MDADDVKAILAQSVKAVEDANVPPELKSLAFEKAIELFTRGSVGAVVSASPAAAPQAPGPPAGTAVGSAVAMDRLVSRLRLPHAVVEAVFTEHGDGLAITVPPDRLSKSRSAGTREIAVLVAAAGQASSDEPTTAEEIRKIVEDYDRLDGPNYASTLSDLKGTFLIGGSSRARTYKLTKPGWTSATSLIAKLGGADKATN